MIELPKQKIKASSQSPRNLIIFSKPKVGKTELVAQLDNALLIDLEKGSNYVDAMKIKVNSIKQLDEVGEAIIKDNYPYKYIVLDTITALEDMCIPYAEELYAQKAIGKKWFERDPTNPKMYSPTSGKAQYGSILNLPNGAGRAWPVCI